MDRIAPEDWYRVQRLADDISLIDEPFIVPFYRCNMWHVRGRERDLLVDSGMGVVSLRAHVPLVTEKTCVAVASHTHFDHIGCHHEFGHCLVHAAEAEILRHPTRANTLAEPFVSDDIFTALPPAPYESRAYNVKGVAAPGLIGDGDVIDLGDRQFTVIHTPGHSPGGIALFEAATGVLISGDIVYDGPLIDQGEGIDRRAYAASLRHLLTLPVSIVHGGHFPSYGGARHRQIIEDWLRRYEAEG